VPVWRTVSVPVWRTVTVPVWRTVTVPVWRTPPSDGSTGLRHCNSECLVVHR